MTSIATKKAALPKREYYKLKQAADELNRFFNSDSIDSDQPVIDVDYLIYLGAMGYLPIYLRTDKDLKVSSYTIGTDIETIANLHLGNKILNSSSLEYKFLEVHSADMEEFELKSTSIIRESFGLIITYKNKRDPLFNKDTEDTHSQHMKNRFSAKEKEWAARKETIVSDLEKLNEKKISLPSDASAEDIAAITKAKRDLAIQEERLIMDKFTYLEILSISSSTGLNYEYKKFISISEFLNRNAINIGKVNVLWKYEFKSDVDPTTDPVGEKISLNELFVFADHLDLLKKDSDTLRSQIALKENEIKIHKDHIQVIEASEQKRGFLLAFVHHVLLSVDAKSADANKISSTRKLLETEIELKRNRKLKVSDRTPYERLLSILNDQIRNKFKINEVDPKQLFILVKKQLLNENVMPDQRRFLEYVSDINKLIT